MKNMSIELVVDMSNVVYIDLKKDVSVDVIEDVENNVVYDGYGLQLPLSLQLLYILYAEIEK